MKPIQTLLIAVQIFQCLRNGMAQVEFRVGIARQFIKKRNQCVLMIVVF